VEVDVADAHVHGRLAVGPGDLALDRDRGVQLGEVQDQVDQRADLLDPGGFDADAAQRDVLDPVKQEDLVPGEVDVGVDLVAGELAGLLRALDRHDPKYYQRTAEPASDPGTEGSSGRPLAILAAQQVAARRSGSDGVRHR